SVDFLHYFMFYLFGRDEKEEGDEWVKTGDIFNEQVPLGDPHETIKLIAECDGIFSVMIDILDALGIRKAKEVVGNYY
ncbi:bifunctional glutamate--cysteine ligase/glutathione synthetase, partial [Enterococcus faecalis]